MRIVYIFLALALSSKALFAQTETFDVFQFTDPDGYERVQSGKEAIQFTRYLDNKAHYCRIIVYAARASSDDAKPEFLNEWNLLIKKVHNVDPPSSTDSEPPSDGWSVIDGASPVSNTKGDYVIMLISIIGHKRAGSIVIQLNSTEFNDDVKKFLESFEPVTSKVATLYPTGAAQQQSVSTGNLNVSVTIEKTSSGSGNELVGIWAGFDMGSKFYGTSSKMKYVAFFEDGSYWNAVGDNGILNYQQIRAASPDTWGTYSKEKNNDIGNIRFGTLEEIFRLKEGVLAYNGVEFKKSPRTDHLKIDGTFTAEKNPQAYNGPEPTITLSSNGRFDDHGAIYWLRHVKGYNTDMQDKMTGSGTYDIYNYTITFKYDDGRLINMTLLDTGDANKSQPAAIRLGSGWLCYRK